MSSKGWFIGGFLPSGRHSACRHRAHRRHQLTVACQVDLYLTVDLSPTPQTNTARPPRLVTFPRAIPKDTANWGQVLAIRKALVAFSNVSTLRFLFCSHRSIANIWPVTVIVPFMSNNTQSLSIHHN